MAYDDVLVHTAVPVKPTQAADDPDTAGVDERNWIEGEPDDSGASAEGGTPGTPIDCCLFLPLGTEEKPRRGRRVVTVPTLLFAVEDTAGVEVQLSPADQLDVTAPEVTGPDPIRWQVDGGVQPFGPPGEDLIGKQVAVKRVDD